MKKHVIVYTQRCNSSTGYENIKESQNFINILKVVKRRINNKTYWNSLDSNHRNLLDGIPTKHWLTVYGQATWSNYPVKQNHTKNRVIKINFNINSLRNDTVESNETTWNVVNELLTVGWSYSSAVPFKYQTTFKNK